MDIAKYIGLYLLKNHFCYVHGLGNIELVKRSATYDGKALQPPSYEVIVTPGGSIDDNLANFIASNEQISISKAANALRDFSSQTRKEIAAGTEVAIPNIGRFAEKAGKVTFITDDNFKFTPAGIPTIKNSKQLDEQNSRLAHKPSFPPPHKADSVNWSMVILVLVLLIIVGGAIFGIYYYNSHNKTSPAPVPVVKDTVIRAPLPLPVDTLPPGKDTSTSFPPSVTQDSLQVNTYKMIIGNYNSRAKAEKRLFNLKKGGNEVDLVQKDTADFLIISSVTCRAADTTHVKDSLTRMFGFKGVMIFR
jgi:nucleoid DNA-binding protein